MKTGIDIVARFVKSRLDLPNRATLGGDLATSSESGLGLILTLMLPLQYKDEHSRS